MLAYITAKEVAGIVAEHLPASPTLHQTQVAMRQAGFASLITDAQQVLDVIETSSPARHISKCVRQWIALSPGPLEVGQARRCLSLFEDCHGKLLPKVAAEVVTLLTREDR